MMNLVLSFVCGFVFSNLLSWIYRNFIMKTEDVLKLLDDPEDRIFCEWILRNKKDAIHFVKMVSDNFIDINECWEMYQREFDE